MGSGIITALLSFVLSIVGALIIERLVRPKSRVIIGARHEFTFLLRANEQQPQARLIRTRDVTVQNMGRGVARSVDIIFNYRPEHFEIWPSVRFTESVNPDNRFIIRVDRLNPRQYVQIEMLSGNELPRLMEVSYEGGQGVEKDTAWIIRPKKAIVFSIFSLALFGLFCLIYLIIDGAGVADSLLRLLDTAES